MTKDELDDMAARISDHLKSVKWRRPLAATLTLKRSIPVEGGAEFATQKNYERNAGELIACCVPSFPKKRDGESSHSVCWNPGPKLHLLVFTCKLIVPEVGLKTIFPTS